MEEKKQKGGMGENPPKEEQRNAKVEEQRSVNLEKREKEQKLEGEKIKKSKYCL